MQKLKLLHDNTLNYKPLKWCDFYFWTSVHVHSQDGISGGRLTVNATLKYWTQVTFIAL